MELPIIANKSGKYFNWTMDTEQNLTSVKEEKEMNKSLVVYLPCLFQILT